MIWDKSPVEFKKQISKFWNTKCIADLISTIVEQSERSGPLVKKSNSGEVEGGAGHKTRWNYVEFRNQIDTEADDE